ncbi:hypothetical protein BDV93DRAFT_554089 [Ceratobasidium sp. AG-I]|nr:hypothetical protein BDV93DRAFT_554089 [Ceratobasidium sp. AG-I]
MINTSTHEMTCTQQMFQKCALQNLETQVEYKHRAMELHLQFLAMEPEEVDFKHQQHMWIAAQEQDLHRQECQQLMHLAQECTPMEHVASQINVLQSGLLLLYSMLLSTTNVLTSTLGMNRSQFRCVANHLVNSATNQLSLDVPTMLNQVCQQLVQPVQLAQPTQPLLPDTPNQQLLMSLPHFGSPKYLHSYPLLSNFGEGRFEQTTAALAKDEDMIEEEDEIDELCS